MVFLLFIIIGLVLSIISVFLCGLAPFITLKDFLFHHKHSLIKYSKKERLDIELKPLHNIDPGYGHWLVHPCVRYIPDGFAGHKWWLVVSPYPKSNSYFEQPVLYYGDSNHSIPPQKWIFVGIVQEPHNKGFNSDPNLYYDGQKLWVFWKETKTENTLEECNWHSIMARSFDGISFGPIQKMADNNNDSIANVFSPTIMKVDGEIVMLATAFEHPRLFGNPLPFGHNHLALWKLNQRKIESGQFVFQKVIKQSYPQNFNFWHADMCQDGSGAYYSVVTDEQARRLLIGISKNGQEYMFNKNELLSSFGNNLGKLYKASMVIIEDDVFVFYPVRTGWLKKHRRSDIYYSKICKKTLGSFFLDNGTKDN